MSDIQLKKDFENYKKKIRESKKTIISLLNDNKVIFNSMKNNITLLNYSQNYSDEFNQNEINHLTIILSYKPDLITKFVQKLLNNFEQIVSSITKNNEIIKKELKNIENWVFTFTESYKEKGLNLGKLYNNTLYSDYLNNKNEEDNDYIFCFLLILSRSLIKIEKMYGIFQIG